jgi:porphobilinogen synthase
MLNQYTIDGLTNLIDSFINNYVIVLNMRFPILRASHLRISKIVRDAVSETNLDLNDLIMPIFIKEGINEPEPIYSMPKYYRLPLEKVAENISEALNYGINKFLLFGIPTHKDEFGTSAYSKDGIVQRALRHLRKEFGDKLYLITDVCLCQYTSHGHCGLVYKRKNKESWYIDHEKSVEIMGRIAVSHAEADADVVAPSCMLDGMVAAIRRALDKNGFNNVAILSYSVKYASGFYSPFREAASSAPEFGDRRSYQMDPRNAYEAIKEARLDVEEGADMLMVKPALAYMDVIRLVKQKFPEFPLAAYNVSGEYSMVKAAVEKGWIDERLIVSEILTGIKRAGADLIITYHAMDVAKWLKEANLPF